MSTLRVIYTRIASDPNQPFWHARLPEAAKTLCGKPAMWNNDAPDGAHTYTDDEYEASEHAHRRYCHPCHAVAAEKAGLVNAG
jgi:hypothetical protein